MSANGTKRQIADAQKFGRFWREADIWPGFMSTRPRRSLTKGMVSPSVAPHLPGATNSADDMAKQRSA
jgi:hypothetical protein